MLNKLPDTLIGLVFCSSALGMEAGHYFRTDGENRLEIHRDASYTVHWKGAEPILGLFEEAACLNSRDKSYTGTHMFYLASGGSCCLDIRQMGSRYLLRNVAGKDTGICSGGVYEEQKKPSEEGY